MKIMLGLFKVLLLSSLVMSCEKEKNNLDPTKLTAIWELDCFIDKETHDTLDAPAIKISFWGNDCLTVFTQCNYGKGAYSINGYHVTANNLELTDRLCYGSGTESKFIRNLSGYYQVHGNTLKIVSQEDANMLFHKTTLNDPYQCDLSTMLIDSIESNRYYFEDIFHDKYAQIYGKWFVYRRFGGWRGAEYPPFFDFLEVKRNGIYGISKGFKLLEYGKIQIEKQTGEDLILEFDPVDGAFGAYSEVARVARFSGTDTLILRDLCLPCDNHYLKRVR